MGALKTCLSDYHERTHRSFGKLIEHCGTLEPEELNRELPGFGYPSVRLQIHHALTAERYWFGVPQGRIDVEDDSDQFTTCEALEELRSRIFANSQEYFESVDDEQLEAARPMMTWGNEEKVLKPVHIIMRVMTHTYSHQGQIMAMCRLMGKPVEPGLDFPILEG